MSLKEQECVRSFGQAIRPWCCALEQSEPASCVVQPAMVAKEAVRVVASSSQRLFRASCKRKYSVVSNLRMRGKEVKRPIAYIYMVPQLCGGKRV